MNNRNNINDYLDKYDDYTTEFDPMQFDRQARRKRKPKARHEPKKSREEIIDEIADPMGLEGGFETTYTPSLYEAEWLMSSLGSFFNLDYITDVLAQVKGGKEASVYRCAAHQSTGYDMLAAKVYRPRMFRQLRNDAMYRQGRTMLNADGKEIKENEQRTMRAVDKKSSYGALVQHTSWLMYEFKTMERLHKLGADVPKPIVSSENAILMTYHGDEYMAAPTLNTVRLERKEARRLLETTLNNIEMMLREGFIHGDLSAFNILYWEGNITLIDFPQVVDAHSNDNAYNILLRDVTRVCDYFTRQGANVDPQDVTDRLWAVHVGEDPIGREADASRWLVNDEDDEDDDYE